MSIAEERILFYNDLAVYRHSNEGKAFAAALEGGNLSHIEHAARAYYAARNGLGVTYDNEQERAEAVRRDAVLAAHFHDLD